MEEDLLKEFEELLKKWKLQFITRHEAMHALMQSGTREQAMAVWNKAEDLIIEEMLKGIHNQGETK